MMQKHYTIKTTKTLAHSLFTRWEALWFSSKESHVFNSPYWARAYIKATSQLSTNFITVFLKDTLIAVLPLTRENVNGILTYTTLGQPLADKSSLLIKKYDQQLIDTLFSYLRHHYSFYLPEVSEMYGAESNDYNISEASLNPVLPVTDNPFIYVSKKQKSKLINKIAHNKKNLSFSTSKNDAHALREVTAFEVESTKGKKGMLLLQDQRVQRVLRNLIKENEIDVIVDTLSFRSTTIAVSIGFQCRKTFYAFYTSFNGEYRTLSPGKLLLIEILKRLWRENIVLLDFGRSYSTLKKEFTPFFVKQYNLYCTHNPLASLWWEYSFSLKQSLIANPVFYPIYLYCKKIVT